MVLDYVRRFFSHKLALYFEYTPPIFLCHFHPYPYNNMHIFVYQYVLYVHIHVGMSICYPDAWRGQQLIPYVLFGSSLPCFLR